MACPRRGLEVEGDAFLAAVAAAKESAHAVDQRGYQACVVAGARVFDLDDLGAQVAQEHGADCAGEEAGQVKDAGGVEGEHGWEFSAGGGGVAIPATHK